jgi:hypothetical protein
MIDAVKLFGTSKDSFSRWLERGYLCTKFPPSRQGVQREYTRENAVEVGFMTALTRVGYDPSEAAPIIAKWMKGLKSGGMPWLFCLNTHTGDYLEYGDAHWDMSIRNLLAPLPDDGGTGAFVADDDEPPSHDEPADTQPAVALKLVFPAEIVARVDKAMEKAIG